MRRSEFKIEDKKEIEALLNSVSYGTLAMAKDNEPYSVPVNYIYENGDIYFHSATKGKKIDILRQNKIVSFSVVKEASFIPSYFSDEEFACPATTFFQSILIKGKVEFIESIDKKVEVMNLLMQKFQPEGKYKKIDKNNQKYLNALNSMAVVKINISEMSAKFKLGQHLSKERFEHIVSELSKRGEAIDSQTIKLMKNFFED